MNSQFRYPIKDKQIKVFEIITSEDLDGYTIERKKYLTNFDINAYILHSTSPEIMENGRTTFQNYITVTINKRYINATMFIEHKGKTYQIQSVDSIEGYNAELTIRAKQVTNYDLEVDESE